MGGGKRSRRNRSYYRAVSSARMTVEMDIVDINDEADVISPPLAPHHPADVSPTAPDVTDSPTIILTPDQIALLASEPPPPISYPGLEEGYNYLPKADPPTIVLEVDALLDAPAPQDDLPVQTPLAPAESVPPLPQSSFPRPAAPAPAVTEGSPHARHLRSGELDLEEDLMRLRRQRMDREAGVIDRLPDEPYISDKLKQWWEEIQPGIDRVLGRSHRAGVRGARATGYQTSAQIPAVRSPVNDGQIAPAIKRLSQAAKQIGTRAQTAAMPALQKLHSRAERMAQKIVEQIDEKLGGKPPLQHVLLGPGRMIVSFAHHVTIRDAQMLIAGVQARSLRRLVGHNAYLVLVPPGREARYAERLRSYREVTGVHFGPQRPKSGTAMPTLRQERGA